MEKAGVAFSEIDVSGDISIENSAPQIDELEQVEDAEPAYTSTALVNADSSNLHGKVALDWSWIRRVLDIQRSEASAQYQLACLSTLGGGYFLCNKHEVALQISFGLFQLGRSMNNRAIIVRALIYLAINFKLLGFPNRSRIIFNEAYEMSRANEHLTTICKSSEMVSDVQIIISLLIASYSRRVISLFTFSVA